VLFRSILLPTLLVPILAATVALVLLNFGLRGERADRGRGGTATALAFLSGFVAMTGWPRWPPIEATQRLFFLVAVAALATWLVGGERKWFGVWFARAALVGAMLPLLLKTPLEHTWTTTQSVVWMGTLFVAGMAIHWAWGESLEQEGDREHWIAAVLRIALLSGTAAILGMSGTARLAQLAGALTCGLGVIEVGSRVLRRRPWQAAAALVPVTAIFGLLVAGHFYANLTLVSAVLVVVSCVLVGVPVGGKSRLRLLALVPLAIALGLTLQATLNAPEDPYADYYGSNKEVRLKLVRGDEPGGLARGVI
jgi:hypothetical protein